MNEVLQVGKNGEVIPRKVRGLITKKKVILANNLIGYLDGEFTFEIKEGS